MCSTPFFIGCYVILHCVLNSFALFALILSHFPNLSRDAGDQFSKSNIQKRRTNWHALNLFEIIQFFDSSRITNVAVPV